MIRFDYLGFVKDYIHVHARMKNYIMYMAMYVQANSTEKKVFLFFLQINDIR